MSVDGGEARQFTFLKQGVGNDLCRSPDGKTIAFTAKPDAEPVDPRKPYRITGALYRYDGIGYLDRAVKNVFIQSLDDQKPIQLTNEKCLASALRFSPDGSSILYLEMMDQQRFELLSSKIKTVDFKGNLKEILCLDWGWITAAEWCNDGKHIVFTGNPSDRPMGSKHDVWTYNLSNGKIECRTSGLKYGFAYGFFNISIFDDEHVLIEVPREGMVEIYRISLFGPESCEPLIQGKRSVKLFDVGENAVLFNNDVPWNPSELAIADRHGKNERIITNLNSEWLKEILLPRVESIHFKNDKGIEIEGWIMLPATGYAPYPTILYIHGGPHNMYGYSYTHDFLMLAGAGYAVLYINPQGSCGYGIEFATALNGNWGILDYNDLMAGMDYAIENGYSDPDRLGVCGLSYGGYSTCFVIGQTNRFKAAVAENPITDLVSHYGTADMGAWGALGQLGGRPHEIPEVYRRSSPITYAHKCTTPTLLVQGEADYRCPAGQSEQFYTMLKANGCAAEMLRLPLMPHLGSWEGPVFIQKAQNEALLEWVDRYIKR